MQEHPIQGLMKTAMENIKEMVDVNTIIGDPVEAPDGSLIIPVSRVSFGFAAGGSEFESSDELEKKSKKEEGLGLPFGGGSGGGVTVQPVGFLIVGSTGQVRMLPVDRHAMLDRLMDMAPQLLNQVQSLIKNGIQNNHVDTTNYQI
ncbi:MAG: GerW family sporulation protein [Dethiobacter sp.]|jgi:sporulation protein YtfJ|nr:GerW family sporulation protein [Dethiobacter sp.]MBS3983073.1 GerW family sporulation protein [Dethiobacter sp.]MCL4462358.1 GerW family sporulation protein [Bacillota bacterium]MCL5993960.1 GerW family sporulation protein [Bacillota bacterium]